MQAQTDTSCTSTNIGTTVKTDCSSKTESTVDPITQASRGSVDWDRVRAGNMARAEARQAQKQEVIDIVYCRQNPTSSLKPAGKPEVSCTEVLAYAQAKCTAEPKSKTCKSLAAIDRKNKK
jgi:hypothetical protein